MQFPEVFTNPDFKYSQSDKRTACADGLTGWGNCMAGNKPPEHFGTGMVKITKLLGIPAGPNDLAKYADEELE